MSRGHRQVLKSSVTPCALLRRPKKEGKKHHFHSRNFVMYHGSCVGKIISLLHLLWVVSGLNNLTGTTCVGLFSVDLFASPCAKLPQPSDRVHPAHKCIIGYAIHSNDRSTHTHEKKNV